RCRRPPGELCRSRFVGRFRPTAASRSQLQRSRMKPNRVKYATRTETARLRQRIPEERLRHRLIFQNSAGGLPVFRIGFVSAELFARPPGRSKTQGSPPAAQALVTLPA